MQADADTAEAEFRIGEVAEDACHHPGNLVGPQIERADHDGAIGKGFHDLHVGGVVVLFGRFVVAIHVQELGPVQANPLGPALAAMQRLMREFDVPEDRDADMVSGVAVFLAAAGRAV